MIINTGVDLYLVGYEGFEMVYVRENDCFLAKTFSENSSPTMEEALFIAPFLSISM